MIEDIKTLEKLYFDLSREIENQKRIKAKATKAIKEMSVAVKDVAQTLKVLVRSENKK